MRKLLLLLLPIIFLAPLEMLSQTGKISGTVNDARTGEAAIGANIIVQGTNYGAATDIEGYYVILNLPPGDYSLRASMIGYAPKTVTNVRVNIDQTTNLNFELLEESIQTEEVVVVAVQPIVQQDISSSRANLTAAEVENLPTVNVNRAIGLQAGVQQSGDGISVRGGGVEETAYVVNGITLRDERDNTPYTAISVTSVDAIQVQTGGFNAEYGNLRSGLVNITTKEGKKDKYSFSFIGRYRPANQKHFGGSPQGFESYYVRPFLDDAVAWTGTKNGAWDEYIQRQYPEFEGWISVAEKTLADDDPTNDLTPEAAQRLYLWEHRRQLDIRHPDYETDMSFGGPVPLVSEALGDLRFWASYRQTKEMYMIPLSTDSYNDYTATFKLTSNLNPDMKLMVEGLYGEQSGTNDNNAGVNGIFRSPGSIASVLNRVSFIDTRIFALDYWAPSEVIRNSVGAKLTHVLNPTTFYELTVSRFAADYSTNPGRLRDTTKIKTFGNTYRVDEAPFGFQPAPSTGINGFRMGVGMSNSRDSSFIASYVAKFDLTSQLDKFNQVKAGFEFVYTDSRTNYRSVDVFLPSGRSISKWDTKPVRASLYAQDKIEFEGMIANVGVRLDYLDPGGEWYVYDPYTNAFTAANSLGIDTLLEKQPTKKQLTVSPRLGIAFPISVDSKLFFNYGHQRQIPAPENLFLIRRFSDNNAIARLANPNDPLPRTIQYELGYEHNLFDQFLLRLAGYYKDVSLQPLLVSYTNRNNDVDYSRSESSSYADIRGFEITISKNRGDWFQGFINYTFDVRTSGRFGFAQYYENTSTQREYERITTSNEQFKPVPRPFARANLNFFSPTDFGPEFAGIYPLGNFRLNILGEWQNGNYFTWAGGGSIPGIENNVQWVDYWNVDLRFSKSFDLGPVFLEFLLDVTNVFNFKYMSPGGYGFVDGQDYLAYMRSLHLPEDLGNELSGSYINVPGDDRPGDYRKSGDFSPIVPVSDRGSVVSPTGAIYYEAASKQYLEYKNNEWVQVDQSRIDTIIDNKQYIDMPNQGFLCVPESP